MNRISKMLTNWFNIWICWIVPGVRESSLKLIVVAIAFFAERSRQSAVGSAQKYVKAIYLTARTACIVYFLLFLWNSCNFFAISYKVGIGNPCHAFYHAGVVFLTRLYVIYDTLICNPKPVYRSHNYIEGFKLQGLLKRSCRDVQMDYVIVSCHYELVRVVWSLQANLIFQLWICIKFCPNRHNAQLFYVKVCSGVVVGSGVVEMVVTWCEVDCLFVCYCVVHRCVVGVPIYCARSLRICSSLAIYTLSSIKWNFVLPISQITPHTKILK